MATNEQIVRKADIAVSDLTNDGGYLNPEQENRFLRKVIEAPTIIRDCRIVRMSNPIREVNKIGFASRILRPGVSATALDAGDRSKPTTEQITLTTKEVIAEVWIPYDVIEDNIERGNIGTYNEGGAPNAGGGLVDTIMDQIAERVATDLEELAILGDTASGDSYLAITDGFLKLAADNVVDVQNATITKEMFKNGLKTLPSKYSRNRASMRHYVSVNNEVEYRDTLANRQTGLGDSNVTGENRAFAYGVPVYDVHLMPETHGLFTNPLNLLMGIQRQIHLETDKDIRSRVFIIVVTARVDFQIEETEALVKFENISSS